MSSSMVGMIARKRIEVRGKGKGWLVGTVVLGLFGLRPFDSPFSFTLLPNSESQFLSQSQSHARLPHNQSLSPVMSSAKKPVCVIAIGMAGSGKSTFVQRLNAHLHSQSPPAPPYVLNLDPAVANLSFEANIDIRDTVDYHEVMKQCAVAVPSRPTTIPLRSSIQGTISGPTAVFSPHSISLPPSLTKFSISSRSAPRQ